MTIDLKYIEAVCNSYHDINDKRFCWVLHHTAESLNKISDTIDKGFVYTFIILMCIVILFLQNRKLIKLLETKLKKEN